MPTIRKRGPRWQAQVRIKQDGVSTFHESATFDTEREARRWGYALEERLRRDGVQGYQERSVSVADLALAWAKHKRRIKPLTRGLEHSLSAILQAPWADRPIGRLTAVDLNTWGMALGQTLAPATVMHHFMVLRSVYAHAQSLLGVTPSTSALDAAMDTLRRSRVLAPSRSRQRRISDEELSQLTLHFAGQAGRVIPMGDFVRLAVALPRRREELLTMRWEDYDGQTLVLRDTKHPSHSRDERVPVPRAARTLIERQPRLDARILPYKPESVSAAFQRAVRALGMTDVRLHDLRHEGISRLFEAGLGVQEAALISGHTSWAALKRYTHLAPLKVLEKLDAGRQKT